MLGDQAWVRDWKHDLLAPWWKGPYDVLTTPAALKAAGIVPGNHHTRVKRIYHADPENAEWTAQRDPTDPRESKTILKKKEKKIPDEPPLRMKRHNQFLLLGLINVILNLTSVSTQDNVFISRAHSYVDFHSTSSCWVCGAMPLSVMDGLPWCSFLGPQKETFLSLVSHNLSLLSWYKPDLQSIDSGHGVTFDVNTSFIGVLKAYTSYLKDKGKKLPDWQGRTGI